MKIMDKKSICHLLIWIFTFYLCNDVWASASTASPTSATTVTSTSDSSLSSQSESSESITSSSSSSSIEDLISESSPSSSETSTSLAPSPSSSQETSQTPSLSPSPSPSHPSSTSTLSSSLPPSETSTTSSTLSSSEASASEDPETSATSHTSSSSVVSITSTSSSYSSSASSESSSSTISSSSSIRPSPVSSSSSSPETSTSPANPSSSSQTPISSSTFISSSSGASTPPAASSSSSTETLTPSVSSPQSTSITSSPSSSSSSSSASSSFSPSEASTPTTSSSQTSTPHSSSPSQSSSSSLESSMSSPGSSQSLTSSVSSQSPGSTDSATNPTTSVSASSQSTLSTNPTTSVSSPSPGTQSSSPNPTSPSPSLTTTTRLISTQQPTLKPNISAAFFVFKFGVRLEMNFDDFDEGNFTEFFDTQIIHKNCDAQICRGFYITNRRKGSVNLDIELNVAASFASKNPTYVTEVLNKTTAQIDNEMYNNINMTYNGDVVAFAKNLTDICQATNVQCGNENIYTCNENQCVHRCDVTSLCGEHGTCQAAADEQILVCRCNSDDVYYYYGDECEHSNIKWEVLVGITAAVGLLIIIVLAIAFICYCNKDSKAKMDHERYEVTPDGSTFLPLDVAESQDAKLKFYNDQRNRETHINQAFHPDASEYESDAFYQQDRAVYNPDKYSYDQNEPGNKYVYDQPMPDYDQRVSGYAFSEDRTGVRGTLQERYDNRGYSDRPNTTTSSFGTPLGSIDPNVKYSIKRPQISLTPATNDTRF